MKKAEIQNIQSKIYTIRDTRVMLDFDLAELYGVETRALNQAVKRNRERFPDDLMLPFLFYVKRKGNPKEKPAPLLHPCSKVAPVPPPPCGGRHELAGLLHACFSRILLLTSGFIRHKMASQICLKDGGGVKRIVRWIGGRPVHYEKSRDPKHTE